MLFLPKSSLLNRALPVLRTAFAPAVLLASTWVVSACAPAPDAGQPAATTAPSLQAPAPQQSSAKAQAPVAARNASKITVAELPRQGQITYQSILTGGPFPFEKDGAIFGNYEQRLPRQARGYYREYTVAPPQARNRGAQRIVCGGAQRAPEVCYYTSDHYKSFKQIVTP